MGVRKEHKIKDVLPGSPAGMAGIKPGDTLLSAGGSPVEDVFDFRMATSEANVRLCIRDGAGAVRTVVLEKDPYGDTGLVFESALMDDYRSCRNRCIFCFIDQMPPGMRETLYFKDDDSRLSFLQGNYVTLTNMSDEDVQRIIRYRLEPINVSVHTTNPDLRCKMLGNRFAGEALRHLRTLADSGIEMNAQIVLCKGINDGAELERTVGDLMSYMPAMTSVSVVPSGLTKYREKLPKLLEFSPEDAGNAIDLIEKYRGVCMREYGTHFIHASDELFLIAGREIPPAGEYDGYPQLENGVGMVRLLTDEFGDAMRAGAESEKKERRGFGLFKNKAREAEKCRILSIATGTLAAPLMEELSAEFTAQNPEVSVKVYPIRNDFFGETITVSGLLTGRDIIAQLKGKDLGDALLLPENLLRSGENVLLDDMSVPDIEAELGIDVIIVGSEGQALYDALKG